MEYSVAAGKDDDLQSVGLERRSAGRVVNILQFGKVSSSGRLLPCVVVNVGEGGLQLRLHRDNPLHGSVTIELRGDLTLQGSIAWQRGRSVGISFASPLTETEFQMIKLANSAGTRIPRLPLCVKGMARDGANLSPFEMLNISPAGAGIRIDAELPFAGPVTLILPKIGAVPAQVCWRDGSSAGVRFNRPLLGDEIMTLIEFEGNAYEGPDRRGQTQASEIKVSAA